MNNPYADIIDLPHHVSKRHPQMPMEKRAAQFSPFAAVSGHDEALHEAARFTEEQLELSEDEIAVIDRNLQWLRGTPRNHRHILQAGRKLAGPILLSQAPPERWKKY